MPIVPVLFLIVPQWLLLLWLVCPGLGHHELPRRRRLSLVLRVLLLLLGKGPLRWHLSVAVGLRRLSVTLRLTLLLLILLLAEDRRGSRERYWPPVPALLSLMRPLLI